jgi:hypothetical protein
MFSIPKTCQMPWLPDLIREHPGIGWLVARQSKPLVQRQSGIHPMVEQRPVGKLVSSPKSPEAGAQRARLYTSLTAGDHNSRMQLTLEDAHSRQRGLIVATSMVLIVAQQLPVDTPSLGAPAASACSCRRVRYRVYQCVRGGSARPKPEALHAPPPSARCR